MESFWWMTSQWERRIWKSVFGNLTSVKRLHYFCNSNLLISVIMSILPSRAPACHSVREYFRFRRPKGNNPSFRSLDHVDDSILCGVLRISVFRHACISYSMYCTYPYVSTEHTCVSLTPPRCKAGAVSGSRTAHQRQRASALLSEIAARKYTKLYRSAQSCASWAHFRWFCVLDWDYGISCK